MATTVMLNTNDGEMAAYDVEPTGRTRGAVVVLQEAYGVNDHIESVARRFGEAGYRAVAPHLFHRSGDPALDYGDLEKVMSHMQALSEQGLLDDIDASLRYLEEVGFGPARIGVVGFCMGGSVTFLAASKRKLGAAVTFYGGGVVEGRFGMPPLLEMAPDLQTPWLGLFGEEDKGIPVDQVEAVRAAAQKAKVPTEVKLYPGAGHGFHCDARPDSYHEASAKDAWEMTLRWFERYLAPAG